MKKSLFTVISLFTIFSAVFMSCNNSETYAEMKDKEKKAISSFLRDNDFVGSINVISESQFYAQDSTTNLDKNEFVLFQDDGIYMQIVRKGEGRTMHEMAGDFPDTTVSKTILCRFFEYDIENADTTYANIYVASVVDKMLVKYSRYSRSYDGTFTYGYMKAYHEQSVLKGWLKPLDYVRLNGDSGKSASVRIIVPHSSGTNNASNYVLPFYYELTYQLPAGK